MPPPLPPVHPRRPAHPLHPLFPPPGAQLHIYRHRDLSHLSSLLSASSAHRKLIVSDSLFSMDGDEADVAGLVKLKERHGALLVRGEQQRRSGAPEHWWGGDARRVGCPDFTPYLASPITRRTSPLSLFISPAVYSVLDPPCPPPCLSGAGRGPRHPLVRSEWGRRGRGARSGRASGRAHRQPVQGVRGAWRWGAHWTKAWGIDGTDAHEPLHPCAHGNHLFLPTQTSLPLPRARLHPRPQASQHFT
jgi:hypothetical protein